MDIIISDLCAFLIYFVVKSVVQKNTKVVHIEQKNYLKGKNAI